MAREGIDASDLTALSRDFGKIGAGATAALFDTFKEGATDLRDQWRENARQTAGKHAKHYPDTITVKPRVGLNIEFEVAPDPRINRQAYLSEILEYGTATNPPHLDATRAIESEGPKLEKAVGASLDRLLRGL